MPVLATRHERIPTQDILSWIFDHVSYDWDAPLYIDALDPSKSISARQARSFILRLTAGFKANGLRKGDTVCVHAFNSVSRYVEWGWDGRRGKNRKWRMAVLICETDRSIIPYLFLGSSPREEYGRARIRVTRLWNWVTTSPSPKPGSSSWRRNVCLP